MQKLESHYAASNHPNQKISSIPSVSLWIFVFLFAGTLAVSLTAFGQDIGLVMPGPRGRPLRVRGGGDAWEIPIAVYSDRELELLVPENLTLAGVYCDTPEYKKDGEYQTYIYTFYKNDNECRRHRIPAGHETDPKWLMACAELRYNRRLFAVDTRKETVTLVQVILMEGDGQPHPELMSFPRFTIPLNRISSPALFHAITRITAMIEQEISRNPER